MTTELFAALERDLFRNVEALRALSRGQPTLTEVRSLDPVTGLVVFPSRRPRMPETALLWGPDPVSCEQLLAKLVSGADYWVTTTDVAAAEAVRRWAAEVSWEAEETDYEVTGKSFRPAPHREVRVLGACDVKVLEGPRPGVARTLQALVTAPEPGAATGHDQAPVTVQERAPVNRVYGVVRDGEWCGDALCLHLHKDIWEIADVAVGERFRRQGMGKGLVTACTEYVLGLGGRPRYGANVKNEASRRTCEALGYVPVDRVFRFVVRAP